MALFNNLKLAQQTLSGITKQVAESVSRPALNKTQQQAPSQPSRFYDEETEKLIDMAIANGELSENGKRVLFNRAQKQGIDLDELGFVLETRLTEKKKSMQAQQTQKSSKYGEVRKCPTCGAFVEPFTTRCPECGFEFTEVGCVSSFEELSNRLREVDSQSSEKKQSLVELVFGEYEDYNEIEKKKAQKMQIIATFPIPTAKEDLLEFISMALPLAKKIKVGMFSTPSRAEEEHNTFADAWRSKVEQVITKARFALKNDPVTLQEIEQYAQELNKKK